MLGQSVYAEVRKNSWKSRLVPHRYGSDRSPLDSVLADHCWSHLRCDPLALSSGSYLVMCLLLCMHVSILWWLMADAVGGGGSVSAPLFRHLSVQQLNYLEDSLGW